MSKVEDEAPGWDAIDEQFDRLYPGQEPLHWGTVVSHRLGGPDILDGLSAYRADEPAPHWHWITYGLTELYAKESDDPDWSGWGYELTMRVPLGGEQQPDPWALLVVKNLANWAAEQSGVVKPGDWFDTPAPLAPKAPGATLTGIGLVADPQLPPIDTPHGRVEFVEVIGLHPDEVAFCREHDLDALVREAGRSYSGEFNEPARASFV